MEMILTVTRDVFATNVMLAFVFAAYIVGETLYFQGRLARDLKRDLGFKDGTTILSHDGLRGYISAEAIEKVDVRGVFHKAGFRSGDVLPDDSHTSLFKSLHRHRGRMVELVVVDGGPGPAFALRTRRAVRFVVPPRGQRREQG